MEIYTVSPWKRFASEYLTELRERDKVVKKGDPNIDVGDVLLVNQKQTPRISRPLGKVLHQIKSPDGHVRGAELRPSKGGTLRRPLNMLYPLEISSNDITEPESDSTIEPDLVSTIDPDPDQISKLQLRTKREAAEIGQIK